MLDRCRPLWKNSTIFFLFSPLQLTVNINTFYENLDSPPLYYNVIFPFHQTFRHWRYREKKEKRSPNVQLISSVASQQSIFLSHLFSNGRQEVSLPHWKCVSRLQTENERVVLDSIAFYLLRVLSVSRCLGNT